MPDWLRLAIGTLTIVRVPPPRRVDVPVARAAMLAAPAVGLLIAVPGCALIWATSLLPAQAAPALRALLVAALTLALVAWLTRALHLDGLADTADALGSARHGAEGLAVMARSDIGPMGVVVLALLLIVQCAALAGAIATGTGIPLLVTMLVASRATLPLTARMRPARPGGLGAGVAGSVSPGAGIGVAAVAIAACAAAWWPWGAAPAALAAGAAVLALVASEALARRCRARFGGITGDVLGAGVEAAATVAAVAVALGTAMALP